MNKKIAAVCNCTLNPNCIGSMDRFYLGYAVKAKQLGLVVDLNENPLHQSNSDSYSSMHFYKLPITKVINTL